MRSAVVGVNTSVMIEAAVVGRSVLTLLDPAFDATQEGTLHFHYLLRENGGFLELARTFDEHLDQLGRCLAGGEEGQERVRASSARSSARTGPTSCGTARRRRDRGASRETPAPARGHSA